MSAPHPAKRRRLDDALSKPFRSPLKTTLQAKASNVSATTTPPTPQSLNIHAGKYKSTHSTPPSATASAPLQPQGPPSSPPTIILPSGTTPTAHLHALQSKHTALLNHLSNLRTNLETSTQALKILSVPEHDAELSRLMQKWKAASQAAAEEVFAGARDKVNRMGGLKGLKERERAKREGERDGLMGGGSWGWAGETRDGGGSEVRDGQEEEDDDGGSGDEENEEDKEEGIGDREERLEREGKGGRWLEEESEYDRDVRRELEDEVERDEVDEEGGYTMDMMLKTMNIDLNVIGYDKVLQRWVD